MVVSLAAAALRRRPLRTLLTALGIAIAVASTVVFLSLGEGMRRAFAQELGSVGPDLQVSYGKFDANLFGAVPELPIGYLETLRAASDRYGIVSVTPVLVHVRSGLAPGTGIVFQGLPAGSDVGAIYVEFAVAEGRGLVAADEGAMVAVVGRQSAERAGVGIGDVLRLNPRASLEVVGIAESAGGLLDNTVLVPLTSLQVAIGVEDRVSFLMLELDEPARATAVAAALTRDFPELGAQTRSDLLSIVERSLAISDVVRLGISAIALIVGAIAVANTMLMSVFERTREFGVVRAVGARPRFLFGLVLLESIVLSLLGAVVGVALGFGGAAIVNVFATDLIGLEVAAVTPRLVAFAVAVAAGMGLLAGLLPAGRAARVPIAVALARE
jgi:putative ABC transport system permease protein